MTQEDIIQTILKDSNYHLSIFTKEEIEALTGKIFIKTVRGKESTFVKCIVRDKDIELKPEEIVRQLFAARLMQEYVYPKKRLAFEYPINFGREIKSADIVIFDKDRPDTSYIIVELKKPKLKDGKNQLRSYCNATSAPIGVWTNGEQISHYHRKDPNYFEDITDLPKVSQSLKDILSERFTLENLIINVLHLNSLDYERWSDKEKDRKWLSTYGKGYERLEKLMVDRNDKKQFMFDILMANPSFAGDIKESRIIHKFELGFNSQGKVQSSVGRDILFIERDLDFLKPGGRMAIVLPQGRFNNTSDKYIREFIAERARILAVVGLHQNTFKPHTGTKTSVLFVQKWDEKLCPKKEDYPIFFAVSEKGGKDNSGDYIFVKNGNGQRKLDKYGHLIVDHDLHNHDGELPNGIAEAFIEFAKAEKLSFWVER
jgi:hypothetical protein